MKTIKFTGLVLIVLTLSARLMAQDGKEQLTISLSEPGKPYKLDVSLTTGTIKVMGYEGKDIIVDAIGDGSKKEERKEAPAGMHRISNNSQEIIAHEHNNTVSVTTGNPGHSASLIIKIPQGSTNIKLGTINGGGISVNDVSGDLEISGVNGSIKLTNITGSVVANTVNGGITANLKSVDPKAAMAFTTLNGSVDVTFPIGIKANLKMRTDHGEVYTDFDMATEKSPSKTTRTEKDGLYKINIDDWVYGKISGGGPEIMMKTMNGSIYVRKAK